MKITLSLTILLFICVNQAHAFIFTDVAAHAQRIQMMGQAAQYINQLNTYRAEFDKYKTAFDDYFKSFHIVYRRLSSADWKDFVPSNWILLKDHYITMWKTFDEGAWQSQVVALQMAPLYSMDSDYQSYADNLISLSEEQVARLKREEAHLIELQKQDLKHHEDLEKFKSRNAALTLGSDKVGNEIALSQQIALTNAILIELAAIQAESKLVEQRLLTEQKEERNLIMRMKQLEIDAQNGDLRNLDYLQSLTKTE
jgi:hypothetical protein